VRRRRNPSLGDVNTLLTLAAIGVAGYVIYKVWGFGKSAVTAVGQTASQASSGVADFLETIFPHSISSTSFAPGSSIIMPDGTEITSDQASGVGAFTATDGTTQIQFYFGGHTYLTAARPDETNTYYALATGATAAAVTAATQSTSALSVQDQLNILAQSG
jgi:hypothetical protein